MHRVYICKLDIENPIYTQAPLRMITYNNDSNNDLYIYTLYAYDIYTNNNTHTYIRIYTTHER